MGKLIYSLNVSLDGFMESRDHDLDFANVDDELHTWFNDQTRELDASIYGRRMYELMSSYWPTAESQPDANSVEVDFGRLWTRLPKIVFSNTLENVDWNSRLVRGDVGDVLANLREEFHGDIDVAGADIARQFIERGLVDEYRVIVHPVILGGGTPFFPLLPGPLGLRLVDTKTFASGVIALTYAAS